MIFSLINFNYIDFIINNFDECFIALPKKFCHIPIQIIYFKLYFYIVSIGTSSFAV